MKRLSATIALFAAVTLTAAEYTWTGTNEPRSDASSDASLSASGTSKITLSAATQTGYTESFATSFAEFLSDIGAIANPAAAAVNAVIPAPGRPVANNPAPSLIHTYEGLDAQALRTGSLIAEVDNIIPAALPRPTGIASRDIFLPGPEPAPPNHDHAHDHDHPVSAPRSGAIESPIIAAAIAEKSSGENTMPSGGVSKLGSVLPMEASGSFSSEPVGFLREFNAPLKLAVDGDISGNGTFTNLVTLNSGMHLIPGFLNKIGEMHLHGGVVFMPGAIWHIDIATAANDRICVWDNLAIQGNPLIPITINLYSINAAGNEGALYNFDPAQPRTWTIAYTAGTPLVITGFDPAYFAINTDAFYNQNPALLGLGDFNIEKIGNTLALTFTPVPEPGAYALMGFGLATLALIRYRRRR